MLLSAASSQLVLVDYQTRLMPAIFEGEFVAQQAGKLLQAARLLGVPSWRTEQNPDKLGTTLPALADTQHLLTKMHFDACEDGLADELLAAAMSKPSHNARSIPKHLQKPATLQRPSIVIAGTEAHVCLLQTALSLLEQEELEVWVVIDACSSRTERNRDAAFDRLAGAGAELVTTEMVLFEWLHTCEHPQFKAVLELIR